MGREIRRVPPDWVHPTDGHGKLRPMHNLPYRIALEAWQRGKELWDRNEHPSQKAHSEYCNTSYADYEGEKPDPNCYRWRQWTPAEATAYQIYEDISEGTPISPVFATSEEMKAWLLKQGRTLEQAERFIKEGWSPSIMAAETPFGLKLLVGDEAMGA